MGDSFQQDDRGFRGPEEAILEWRDFADGPDRFQRREHERERLLLAVLEGVQSEHSLLVFSCDHQMEPAEAFHGDNPALADGVRRSREHGFAVVCGRG